MKHLTLEIMNIVNLLNDQLNTAASDLEKAKEQLTEIENRHKAEKSAAKLNISVLESVISDIEKKIKKLEG